MSALRLGERAVLASRSAALYAGGLRLDEVAGAISAGADGLAPRASSVTGVRRWLSDAGVAIRPKGHAGRRIRLDQAAGRPVLPDAGRQVLADLFAEVGWIGGVVVAVADRGYRPVTARQVRYAVRGQAPPPRCWRLLTQAEFDRLHAAY